MSSARSKFTIDLDAIAHNWKLHAEQVFPALCSAVVKADAYGLGVKEVCLSLYKAGCRAFFVASLQEAVSLRTILDEGVSIFILSGVMPGEERECLDRGFVPVLVSVEMFRRWLAVADGARARSSLKVDTGMGRFGISLAELTRLVEERVLERAGVKSILSHLACADEPGHELNQKQLERFADAKNIVSRAYPEMSYCLANSSGCALGADYHFDMVRPGIALYGSKVQGPLHESLKPVVSMALEVIQVRPLPAGEPLGYGATSVSDIPRTIAVAAGGYADGLFRSLGNSGRGFVDGHEVPIAGRITMDATMFDITAVEHLFNSPPFPQIELLGPEQGIDELARDADTVGYEVLTSLGERFKRVYLGGEE